MITIFCDFPQFLAKKLAFFLNTNVMINFFENLASFRVKNKNSARVLKEELLKVFTLEKLLLCLVPNRGQAGSRDLVLAQAMSFVPVQYVFLVQRAKVEAAVVVKGFPAIWTSS
jgi:hypothetical protein